MNNSEFNLQHFYNNFRSICKPPMEKIADLEIGELWFYSRGVSVICCLGEKSLLVAYYTYGPKEEVINQFKEAYYKIDEKDYMWSIGLHLVFAAREQEDGTLDVSLFRPGDWCGLLYIKPTLPESRVKNPRGWK